MTCPSEAILDAYELDETIDESARKHVESCSACAARLAERKQAFNALDKETLVRSIHMRVADSAPARRVSHWRRAIGGLSLAAAAGIAAMIFVVPQGERTKGSIGFDVFVERDGVVRRAVRSTAFHPGDRLRFEVDLPKPAHVLIVGIEADGTMYSCYPPTKPVAAAEKLPEGVDQILAGAVELDETLGREELHLVACDHPFDSSAIAHRDGKLMVPEGCEATPFVLDKKLE
jgi:hypothetical protein